MGIKPHLDDYLKDNNEDLIDVVNRDIKKYMRDNNFSNYEYNCIYLDYCTSIFKKNRKIVLENYIEKKAKNVSVYDKHLLGITMIEKNLSELIDLYTNRKEIKLENRKKEDVGILYDWVLWIADTDSDDYVGMITIEGEEIVHNWSRYEQVNSKY
jgi:hypothetical protein